MKYFIYLISITIVLLSFSCKKDNNNTFINYQVGVDISKDYASAQHLLINISSTYFKVIYDTILFSEGHNKIDEAIVSYYPDSIYQIVIYYPEWGTDDGYGNWKQGEIFIKADSGFFNTNYPSEIFFSSFNTDKDTIRATSFVYSYLGENEGDDNFNMEVINGTRSFEDTTGIISFDANFNIDVNINVQNGNKNPKMVYFFGEMSGLSRSEYGFQAQSQQSMISDLSCNWIKGGIMDISYSNVEYTGTIFYSDTSLCRNWYNLEIDGVSFPTEIVNIKTPSSK